MESTDPKSDRNLFGQEGPWQCIWQALPFLLVKHSIPQIHTEASAGVLALDLIKDDRDPILQACPKFNSNKPNGEYCWRLVFAADGINWWREHHCQRTGAGLNQLKFWSKPNSSHILYHWGGGGGGTVRCRPASHNFISWGGQSSANFISFCVHIMCALCEFLPAGGDFARGLLWQSFLCF